MTEPLAKLTSPPIVEAVVDVDCDMLPGPQLPSLESAVRAAFGERYPKFRVRRVREHRVESAEGKEPTVQVHQAVESLMMLQEDEKQIVQVRLRGFSFNRLPPYTGLDGYLEEIELLWRLYLGVVHPLRVRTIRLRFINRILLPLLDGRVRLDDYFRVSPQLPDEIRLSFVGFLNQHEAVEEDTGHQVHLVLAARQAEGGMLPVVFDNCVVAEVDHEPTDWQAIHGTIKSLRDLKNRLFQHTLTEKCLNLFRQP